MHGRGIRPTDSVLCMSRNVAYAAERVKLARYLQSKPHLTVALEEDLIDKGMLQRAAPSSPTRRNHVEDATEDDADSAASSLLVFPHSFAASPGQVLPPTSGEVTPSGRITKQVPTTADTSPVDILLLRFSIVPPVAANTATRSALHSQGVLSTVPSLNASMETSSNGSSWKGGNSNQQQPAMNEEGFKAAVTAMWTYVRRVEQSISAEMVGELTEQFKQAEREGQYQQLRGGSDEVNPMQMLHAMRTCDTVGRQTSVEATKITKEAKGDATAALGASWSSALAASISSLSDSTTTAPLPPHTTKLHDGSGSASFSPTKWLRQEGSPTKPSTSLLDESISSVDDTMGGLIDDPEHAKLRQNFRKFMESKKTALIEAQVQETEFRKKLVEAEGNMADIPVEERLPEPHNRRHIKNPGDRFGHVPPEPEDPAVVAEREAQKLKLPEYTLEELADEKMKLVQFYAHVAPFKTEPEIDFVLQQYAPPDGFKIMWADLYEKYFFAPMRKDEQKRQEEALARAAEVAQLEAAAKKKRVEEGIADEAGNEIGSDDDDAGSPKRIAIVDEDTTHTNNKESPKSVAFSTAQESSNDVATTVTGSFAPPLRSSMKQVATSDTSMSTSHRTTSALNGGGQASLQDFSSPRQKLQVDAASKEDQDERIKWKRRFSAFYALVVPPDSQKSSVEIDRTMNRYRDEMYGESDGAPYELMMHHLVRKYGNSATNGGALSIAQIIVPPKELREAQAELTATPLEKQRLMEERRAAEIAAAQAVEIKEKQYPGQLGADIRGAVNSLRPVDVPSGTTAEQRAAEELPPALAGAIASQIMTMKLAFTLDGFDFTIYHNLIPDAKPVLHKAFENDLMANIKEEMERVLGVQHRLIEKEKRSLAVQGVNDDMLEKHRASTQQYRSSKALWKRMSAAIEREKKLKHLQQITESLPQCGEAKVTRVVGGTLINVNLKVPQIRSAVATISEALIAKVTTGEFLLPTLKQTHQDAMGVTAPRLAVSGVAVFGGASSSNFNNYFEEVVSRDATKGRQKLKRRARGSATVMFDVVAPDQQEEYALSEYLRSQDSDSSFSDDEDEEERMRSANPLQRFMSSESLRGGVGVPTERKATLRETSEELLRDAKARTSPSVGATKVPSTLWWETAPEKSPSPLRRRDDGYGSQRRLKSLSSTASFGNEKRFVDAIWEVQEYPSHLTKAEAPPAQAERPWSAEMIEKKRRGKPMITPKMLF